MISLLGNLLGSVVDNVGGIVKKDKQIQEIKAKGRLLVEQSKIDLEVAKLKSEAKMETLRANNDAAYDLEVIRNRKESLIDELIIIGFMVIMVLTFIPATQSTMAIGWEALSDAPWWFEFGIIGILVSTLGLKDVLKIFIGGTLDRLKKKQ